MSLTPRYERAAPYTPRDNNVFNRFDYVNTPRPSTAPSRSSSSQSLSSSSSFAQSNNNATKPALAVPTRHGKFEWNKHRNPIVGSEADILPVHGKKAVPSYFDHMQESPRKSGRGKAPDVDVSRAGLPIFLQRMRTHEEDLYVRRPSTAPAATTPTPTTSAGFDDSLSLEPNKGRRPCPIGHLNVKRNPLVENDDQKPIRKDVSKFNKQTDIDNQKPTRKPHFVPEAHKTRSGFIPMDEPKESATKLRTFVPEDNEDVFYYRHSLGICPPDNTALVQRQQERIEHEGHLQQALNTRKQTIDDQIQKHKERMAKYASKRAGAGKTQNFNTTM